MFEVRQLQPFGIEINGDLDREFSDQEQDEFRKLFFEHGMVLARNQTLSREAHERIGDMIAPVIRSGDKEFIANIYEGDVFKNEGLAFHYDNYYSPAPHDAVSLYALDVTPGTASTRLVNTTLAVRAMSDEMVRELAGLKIRNILTSNNPGRNYLQDQPVLEDCEWPQRIWPLIDANPVTGVPFVTATQNLTDCVVGLDFAESERILEQVFALIYDSSQIYEHHWRNGDMLIWDNYAVQHGRPEVPEGTHRVLQRISVGGRGFFDMHPEVARQLSQYVL